MSYFLPYQVQNILDNLIPEAVWEIEKSGIEEKTFQKGTLWFKDKELYLEAWKLLQKHLRWISDEFIHETVIHEEQHIEEARIQYGPSASYFYRLHAIQMRNGNIGVQGSFFVGSNHHTQEEIDERKKQVISAPNKWSPFDLRSLGIAVEIDPNDVNIKWHPKTDKKV